MKINYFRIFLFTVNTQVEVKEHREDNAYVKLPATNECLEILHKTNILAIIGPSGSGKSKCALEILSTFVDTGIKVMKLADIKLWNEVVNAEQPCCVWFDDLLDNVNDSFLDQNRSTFQTIKSCARSGNVKVILTIRSDVYNNLKSLPFWFILETNVVDLDDPKYQLTRDLRIQILNCHLVANRSTNTDCISELMLDDIVQSKPLLGFPLCCHLFSAIESNFQKGAVFFSCPSRELIAAIDNLKTYQKQQYLVLAYAALKSQIVDTNALEEDLINVLSKELEISDVSFRSTLQQTVRENIYFKRRSRNAFEIKHLSIYQAIMVTLSETSDYLTQKVVSVLSPSILNETLQFDGYQDEQFEYRILIPDYSYPAVANTMRERVGQGFTSLFCCKMWNSETFIHEIMKGLGDDWSMFCNRYFRYGCKYGKLALVKEMLKPMSVSPAAFFVGIKEACFTGNEDIVHFLFEHSTPIKVSTDEAIQLISLTWKNFKLCIYLIEQLSKTTIDSEQCKSILTHIARDNNLKLIKEAIRLLNIQDSAIVLNTALIAGKRGSLDLIQWLLRSNVDIRDSVVHNAMLGVCKGGCTKTLIWLLSTHRHVLKEHLNEYLENVETPAVMSYLLENESHLTKLDLGEMLNKHCAHGRCFVVKVIIDKCDCLSETDIQNAMEIACKHEKLDTFTVLADTFSVCHAERVAFINDVQERKAGKRGPMSAYPFTPAAYVNIPSVNISTPNIYSKKHPVTTIKRSLKRAMPADEEAYRKAMELIEMCDDINGEHSYDCRTLLTTNPKIPEYLLTQCCKRACIQQNDSIVRVMCETNKTLPQKVLDAVGNSSLETDVITCIHRTLKSLDEYSLLILIKHAIDAGKDIQQFICALCQTCQFDRDDYLEALGYTVNNHSELFRVLLDFSNKLTLDFTCDDILLATCMKNNVEVVRSLLQQGRNTDLCLKDTINIMIAEDNEQIFEIFLNQKSFTDISYLFLKCCENSATACAKLILQKRELHAYLQTNINDILSKLCLSNAVEVLKDVLGHKYIHVEKNSALQVLSQACEKNWHDIKLAIWNKFSFTGGEVVKLVKGACKTKNIQLARFLIMETIIYLTLKQRVAVLVHVAKCGYYADASKIIEMAISTLSDANLRNLPLPTECTQEFTDFVCKVILYSDYIVVEEGRFLNRILSTLPGMASSVLYSICKSNKNHNAVSCLRLILCHYTGESEKEVLKTGLQLCVENVSCRAAKEIIQTYAAVHGTDEIKSLFYGNVSKDMFKAFFM